MRVTLSFDNGPDPLVTPRVLDVLARAGVKAHFYVLGKHLGDAVGRRSVERARDEGHVVGNHSFSHEVPLGDDPREDAVEREIVATEALLSPLVPGPALFRPFGGGGVLGPHLLSGRAVSYLVERRYSCVLWNSVPRDWEDPGGWPARALADCERHEHAVVVLHDVPGASLDRLEAFLGDLIERGAALTTDLPGSCVPIVDGVVRGDLSGLVRSGSSST